MENLDYMEYMNQARSLMGQEKYQAAILFLEKADLSLWLPHAPHPGLPEVPQWCGPGQ